MPLQTHSSADVTAFQPLIDSVRFEVRRGHDRASTATAVAGCLRNFLGQRPALPDRFREATAEHYVQHLVHAEDDGSFSIVVLVWLPGQCTPIHDHAAWCVTGVVEGEEDEQRYGLREEDQERPVLVTTERVINHEGEVAALAPPGDIHRVSNSSNSLAMSIHIYGADISALGSSVRRIYDYPVHR